ncbi:hypothetical protein [Streptomyces pharetrae]|uniref:hypothetical protein n=1 Tax=Streptomyces pharetrae TaxID=291370 RepID=UPI00384C171A
MAGMVRGNLTLLQATAVTDRWGATHYGHLSGLLAAPATTAAALARFAGAALTAPLDGYGPLFFLLATVSAGPDLPLRTASGCPPPAEAWQPARSTLVLTGCVNVMHIMGISGTREPLLGDAPRLRAFDHLYLYLYITSVVPNT